MSKFRQWLDSWVFGPLLLALASALGLCLACALLRVGEREWHKAEWRWLRHQLKGPPASGYYSPAEWHE